MHSSTKSRQTNKSRQSLKQFKNIDYKGESFIKFILRVLYLSQPIINDDNCLIISKNLLT